MTFALQNGAAGVMALGTVEEAFRLREEQGGACLLGGERGGIRIEGFDLSNSPDDYGPEVVREKTIGFTTTNGTKALLMCQEASRILIGAFVNISAVAKVLLEEQGDVHIVCAGTDGAITGEDVLFAGALTDLVQEQEACLQRVAATDDSTEIAVSLWRQQCGMLKADSVEAALRIAQGGRNLIKLGYDKDIATASQCDCVDVVGEVGADGVIRILRGQASS